MQSAQKWQISIFAPIKITCCNLIKYMQSGWQLTKGRSGNEKYEKN
jgi:hypothetical protein